MHSKTHITAARYAAIRASAIRLGRQADLMDICPMVQSTHGDATLSDPRAVSVPLYAAAELLTPARDEPPSPAECLAILAEGWGRQIDHFARNMGEILTMHGARSERVRECVTQHAQARSEFRAHLCRQPLRSAPAVVAYAHALAASRLYADQLQALAMGFRAAQLASDACDRRIARDLLRDGVILERAAAGTGVDALIAAEIDEGRRAAVRRLDAATAAAAVLMGHEVIV